MSIHVQTDAVDDTLNLSRHIATSLDRARFTLSVKQSTELFADAGVPRSARAITRYCKQGEIDFIPVDTERNAKWLLDRQSVERRIEQLRQSVLFAEEDQSVSRHVETADENNVDLSRHVETEIEKTVETQRDVSRQRDDGASRETPTRLEVIHLDERERELLERLLSDREEQIKSLTVDKDDLRDQIKSEREMRKREQEMHMEQVKLLAASDRDTKGVTKTIANLINNIWPGTKGSSNGEQPVSLSPVIHDVTDNLGGAGNE